ncbi:VOC family protein [Streptomyces sp. SCA3-4]|uniref:VOC family protein n=1 Tax=Streptomyces sichuanensis TaxID=2871810 RepID=UPI001CE3384E|nr:VOC family protein [Streptomyces sichuanensis]MCA6092575.1 VOC family protein [Streptomyces sichuanensis]
MTEVWGSSGTGEEEGPRQAPGTPCWTGLMVHDLETAKEFYGALFGWSYYDPGPRHLGPYVRATLDGRNVAGIGELPPDRQLTGSWTTYLASDDADVCAEWIHCAGGTVGVGPLAAERAGRLVLASDPAGASFGVWQGQRLLGSRPERTPGTPVWHELVTHDASVVLKFYRALFGYEAKAAGDMDGETVTLHVDGRPVAAIRSAGPGLRQPHWMPYFEAADVDTAAGRVTELGGRVVSAPQETPAGRVATVTDPEGSAFTLLRTAG